MPFIGFPSRALVIAAALALAGCAFYPKPDGVTLAGADGIDAVIQNFHIPELDPKSTVPLTQQALEAVERTDPFRLFRGTTYDLTEGNHLDPDWLIQTPDIWGKPAAAVTSFPVDCPGCDPDFRLPACASDADCGGASCRGLAASALAPATTARKFCVGHSDVLIDRFYNAIASAERAVDVTLLQPSPDFRFRAALRAAVTRLAYSGRTVTLRFLIGNYPPDGADPLPFLRELVRDADKVPGARLRIFVGVERSCDGGGACKVFSWNHAKIVAVDGKRAIVGGHNLWTGDYLAAAPVHDVSMEVYGPVAHDAHRFADAEWDFLCDRPSDDALNRAVAYRSGGAIERGCLSSIGLPRRSAPPGNIRILAIGRLAAGIKSVFADQSLIARGLLLGAATKTIRMIQQDVAFSLTSAGLDRVWPTGALERITDLVLHGGDAYLVLSNLNAAGPVGGYSNGVPIDAVAHQIEDIAKARTKLPPPELDALLCQHLHLAPLRFGPDATWPDNKPIAVHAKFWMVDERLFYIGSENLYPVDLQEFGYVVEDAAATKEIRQKYWDPAWQWSSRAAISGSEAASCVFSPHPPDAAAAPKAPGPASPPVGKRP